MRCAIVVQVKEGMRFVVNLSSLESCFLLDLVLMGMEIWTYVGEN
jgi:hypothetical protein